MSKHTVYWQPSKSGKDGHEDMMVRNEKGQETQMAFIHPSSTEDRAKGFTLVKRDMNYGLGDRFIPQEGNKEWNLAYEGAKDRGERFAEQQLGNAHQLVGETPSHEMRQDHEEDHEMAHGSH